VFGGAELVPGDDGKPARRYLADAYRYRPTGGWMRIADLPHPVAAAPALAYGSRYVLAIGGDDGSLTARGTSLGDAHPGFSRDLLCYDTTRHMWASLQQLPALPVTTNACLRGGTILIPTGEDRPGHRTPAVYALEPQLAQ
jgi:N-acetylneuraminic acid mutarotase